MAIAIGEVVDDAIIDVENIYRRLRENRELSPSASPRSILRVVLDASLEVRNAVVYATFVVALVFVPILTMSGLQGRMMSPLGVAYILAIMASLAVALTVTPALCMVLLPKRAAEVSEPRLLRGVKSAYRRLMRWVTAHPAWVVGPGILLCAGALAMIPTFGGELLPEFREGHFVLQVSAVPGTSLQEMRRLGALISHDLLEHPAIATIDQQIGRADLGEDPWGPHRSEFHVELKPVPAEQEADVQRDLRDILSKFPGITYEVLTFLGDRIGETITGETAAVVINVYGDDLDVLDAKVREIAKATSSVAGAADVQVASPPGTPQLALRLRPDRLLQFGFQPLQVLEVIQTAYQGVVATQVYQDNRVIDVAVILQDQDRRDPQQVGQLLLRDGQGSYVPLRELVELVPTTGRSMILHDGARRRQTVTCNVQDRHLVTKEGMSWGLDAVLRGASERVIPILMTDLVAALGLLPLAIGTGEPGREIEGPMAAVILGGLATSTLLNLLILPTLAWRYGRFGGDRQTFEDPSPAELPA